MAQRIRIGPIERASVSRRRLLALGAGGSVVAFLAACGGGSKDETKNTGAGTAAPQAAAAAPTVTPGRYTTAPRTGKTRDLMTVAVAGLPATLDPAHELSNVGTRTSYSMYDTPIRRDFFDNNKLVPSLAAAWERADDLNVVLKLRDGVTFHNGEPMSAEDVVFTFERMSDPKTDLAEARGYFSTFDKVQMVDRLTARITTSAPDPLLEKRLASWASWVVSKAYISKVGNDEFQKTGMGTGPYRGVRLEPDNQLIMERHEGYWDEKPGAKRIVFRVVPEVAARVTALINNEAQIITNIPPDQVKTLKEAPSVDLRDIPLANMHVLSYNANHAVLKSEKLRQALNLGIDRMLLVDTLWNGRAVLTRGHQFEEYGDMYNPNRPFLPYDKTKAKALVAESGYKGDVITYRTQNGYYTNGLQAGEAIIQMWKEIGVNAQILLVGAGDKEDPPTRMVANWSNSSILADPDGSFWRSWGNGNAVQKYWWTPADPEFNRLGLEARSTLDQKQRSDNFQKMYDIWEREAPGTVLYIPVENYGVSKEVNWSPYPFYYMDLRVYNLSFNK